MSRSYERQMEDAVNHPPHYNQGEIECIDAIREMLGTEGFVAYCRGNALKYTWRCKYKGKPAEDLAKAQWYLKRAEEAESTADYFPVSPPAQSEGYRGVKGVKAYCPELYESERPETD